MKRVAAKARTFLYEDLWDTNLNVLPGMSRMLHATLRVILMVIRGFVTDRCGIQASAMTYFTLMALVPVLAMMLSVSKGFRAQDRLLDVVGLEFDTATREVMVLPDGPLAELPGAMVKIIKEIYLTVEDTNFSTLGIVGILLLFYSVVKTMGRIESTFNSIWGVTKARTIVRKFSDYISVLVTFPIMLLLATSANATLRANRLNLLLESKMGGFFWIYEKGLGMSSVIFVVLGFSLLYMFMPNTRVRFMPALVGGLVAGLLFVGWQWFYFTVQIGAAKQNPIFGTFAAIPLFLIFVQVGWLLVLFGAEVSFAMQNFKTYYIESSPNTLSFATQQLLGLLIVTEVAREFHKGGKWNAVDYSSSHNIPSRITSAVLERLLESDILIAVNGDSKEIRYVPGKDLAALSLAEVSNALRGLPLKNIRQTLEQSCPAICAHIRKLDETVSQELGDKTLHQLVSG